MNIKHELSLALSTFSHNNSASLFKDPEIYVQWLAQTYYFVRHSVPLLGFAIPHLKNDELKHRFEHHMGEEDRHDLMLIKDMNKMGHRMTEFPEWALTQGFYQSQYYRIQFEGGTALLGYILFLEGLAASWAKDGYEQIKNVFPGSVLFLKVHAEEDPTHLDEAMNTILKLTSDEQQVILRNLHYTHEIYQKMFNKMCEVKVNKKAA